MKRVRTARPDAAPATRDLLDDLPELRDLLARDLAVPEHFDASRRDLDDDDSGETYEEFARRMDRELGLDDDRFHRRWAPGPPFADELTCPLCGGLTPLGREAAQRRAGEAARAPRDEEARGAGGVLEPPPPSKTARRTVATRSPSHAIAERSPRRTAEDPPARTVAAKPSPAVTASSPRRCRRRG